MTASPSGAGSGYVWPTVVNNALDCLAKGTGCGSFKPSKTYPDLRGAMTWCARAAVSRAARGSTSR
nr:hypothetical protein [Streptomyces sp. DSM 15324]